jgi:hypothetical protein
VWVAKEKKAQAKKLFRHNKNIFKEEEDGKEKTLDDEAHKVNRRRK